MQNRTFLPTLLALGTLALILAPTASATTINPVPDIMPVVWPLTSSSAALNVTFALHDCSNTANACPIQSVSSGTTPTFTLTLRNAGQVPLTGITRAMIACGGSQTGWWCYNETVNFDQSTNGAYVAYGGMIMWSTGVSPANTWTGESFVLTAKEVRLTSSINEADLPEGRAHANSTWESQQHANATWCALSAPCDSTGYESAAHANTTWEGQPHANATWESQPHANATWEGQPHANATWESQVHANATWCATTAPCDAPGYEGAAHANATWERQTHANTTWESQVHANATWCPQPACAINGDQLVSRSYADSTYEGQPHANATWVRNSWFNGTFRPNANFGAVTMTSLNVGSASAGDVTISGSMTAQTALDPYVMPLVFGGLTVFSTAASLWIAKKPGILGKLAIATLLVVITIWAASATVSSDASAFRWVAVVITAGWVIIVLISMKGGR